MNGPDKAHITSAFRDIVEVTKLNQTDYHVPSNTAVAILILIELRKLVTAVQNLES